MQGQSVVGSAEVSSREQLAGFMNDAEAASKDRLLAVTRVASQFPDARPADLPLTQANEGVNFVVHPVPDAVVPSIMREVHR